jgi:hypothetical protein
LEDEIKTVIVSPSPLHQRWREKVIFSRAKGIIRNRSAYLRTALPPFIADEDHEIGQWLASQLIEYIQSNHPSVSSMQAFVTRIAESEGLPLNDDLIDPIVEVAYFKWKSRLTSESVHEIAEQNAGLEISSLISP